MRKAIAQFNSWQCPECKKFIGKGQGMHGKCQFCGEELLFLTEGKEEPKAAEAVGPIETGSKPLTPTDVLEKYFTVAEQDGKLVINATHFAINNYNIPKEVPLLSSEFVTINFDKKPLLYSWLKKFGKEKDFTMQEVVLGFLSKGVRNYLEKTKETK